MSTLASADLGPSDDEEDADFVPQASKRTTAKKTKRRRSQSPSDGDSQSSDSDDDAEPVEDTEAKRLKLDQEEAEAAEARRRAAETFAAMKQSAVVPKVEAAPKVEVKLVQVKRPRRFAGETLYETVMLPADDPEAVEYMKKSEGVSPALKNTEGMEAKSGESSPLTAAGPSVANQAKKPAGKGPPRRKTRQSLEQMSAALDKGKKMTTLEKSAMDWKALTTGDAQLADELEANRRGGGYVEKQDFLDRVGERRADSQQKPTQRRT